MSYRVEILRRAAKALSQLPVQEYERVRDEIRAKKLVGRDGWRMRVGRYRVIYEVEDTVHLVTGARRRPPQ